MITDKRPEIPVTGFYNVSQTARILGHCRKTVRTLAEKGRLTAGKNAFGETMFSGEAILRYYDAKCSSVQC